MHLIEKIFYFFFFLIKQKKIRNLNWVKYQSKLNNKESNIIFNFQNKTVPQNY